MSASSNVPIPGQNISDATRSVTDGGAAYIAIPSGQTASLTFTQIGRVCYIINGSTTQSPNITFTDGNNWQFFDAQALAPNEVVDLQFPPSGAKFTVAFSAATSGPLTITYN